MNRFKSKVAIVTGAGCVGSGWGNGRAMAVRLAEEGAKVFAVDRDPERLAETLQLAGEAWINLGRLIFSSTMLVDLQLAVLLR